MPTSSLRFEKWGALSVEHWNLRLIVGKTTMGNETMEAMAKHDCVHVSPQCVRPNLWHSSIAIQGVELFDELGSIEACWQLGRLLSLDIPEEWIAEILGNNMQKILDKTVLSQ